MSKAEPCDGLRVTLLASKRAEEHVRRTHNVPDDVLLGWRPYTIIVTSYGGVAHTAFWSMREFRRWLGRDFKLSIFGPYQHPGMRVGKVVAR